MFQESALLFHMLRNFLRQISQPLFLPVPYKTNDRFIYFLQKHHCIHDMDWKFQYKGSKKCQRNTDKPDAAGINKQAHDRITAASQYSDYIDIIKHLKWHKQRKYDQTGTGGFCHCIGNTRLIKPDHLPSDSHNKNSCHYSQKELEDQKISGIIFRSL